MEEPVCQERYSKISPSTKGEVSSTRGMVGREIAIGDLNNHAALTLFYTRGLGIVFSHVMVPEPYGLRSFHLLFHIGMAILTILEFSSKWLKVILPFGGGGGLPVVGGGVGLMTQSASVTTQSIPFKYVMASELNMFT